VEIRQLRYFVRVVEAGSIGRAARELELVASALSQQLTRLESELSTRLLRRTSTGVTPTDAGLAFYQHAQLALRHTDAAAQAARQARLTGHVNVGLSPSVATVMALPFVQAMQSRYPDIRVRLVGSLSSNLAGMLNARQLDMALLFSPSAPTHGTTLPLLEERMFLIGHPGMEALRGLPPGAIELDQLAGVPLVLGSRQMRSVVDDAFARIGLRPHIALEIDGLEILMSIVAAGLAATVQSGAATAQLAASRVRHWEIADTVMRRQVVIASVSEHQMSPAALATRIVLRALARELVASGRWPGAVFTARDEPVTPA
jgi:LysR family tcuABC transcriptional regulator